MSYKKVLITSNNSYCESYKRALIASNNPIQLFNSSLNPGNTTKSGITMANNGDGTFTFNGTSTAWAYFSFPLNLSLYAGHKILMTGCPSGGSFTTYYMDINYTGSDTGNGTFAVISEKSNGASLSIGPNQTVTNLIYKPQIIDFTAIFGKGNEPKNLAEAKTKFTQYFSTETVYPYNPSYCLSPKSALITPTKNLFNLASANSVSVKNGYWIQTAGIYAPTGYFYELDVTAGEQYTVSYDLYTTGGHDALAISVQTGKGYLPVADSGKRLTIGINGYDSKKAFARHVQKFTIPGGVTHIYFTGSNNGNFRNFQIEKGNIAVADIQYVPYNYI